MEVTDLWVLLWFWARCLELERLGFPALFAPLLSREFAPKFEPLDLQSLPNYDIYIKLLIDGTPSRPFSATTLLPSSVSS